MELSLELPRDHHYIRSVGAEGIRIDEDYYHGPLIVSAGQIIPEWEVRRFSDLDAEKLEIIFDLDPELVLIGCGKTQAFLPPALQMQFLERNIGIEVMVTDAACRTFNLLAGDGRHVVAALIWDH
jgi:uncharacterized protein